MTSHEKEAIKVYRQLVHKIGTGFHPDTPFNGYEPPIDFMTEGEFETILDAIFGIEGFDPYGDGLDVFNMMREAADNDV